MSKSENPHRRSGMLMLWLGWLVIFGLGVWFFQGWLARQDNPNSYAVLSEQAGGQVTLERNRAGHYVAEGEINGERVTFLLDTGATQVALGQALADRLGLKRGAPVVVHTANGTTQGYATRINQIRLGSIVVHDVGALVTAGIEGDTVLLGMTFLQRVEFTQREGQLTLRPI